jgi:hypothetical protein
VRSRRERRGTDEPSAYPRFRLGASVTGAPRHTPALDEDQASAGAQFGPTALLHPWKATVARRLSPSMELGSRRRGHPRSRFRGTRSSDRSSWSGEASRDRGAPVGSPRRRQTTVATTLRRRAARMSPAQQLRSRRESRPRTAPQHERARPGKDGPRAGGAGHAPQTELAESEAVSGDRTRPPLAHSAPRRSRWPGSTATDPRRRSARRRRRRPSSARPCATRRRRARASRRRRAHRAAR